MVNTGDIHEAEEALENAKSDLVTGDQNLDDVMLAMDVVDTLRHEKLMVEKELAGEDRREALVARLREIYTAQGIQVSDEVLMDGVMALEEQRFVFEPPKKSFGLSLAKLYVNRRRWMPLLTITLLVIGAAWSINHFAFERPAQQEIARAETLLSKTLPDQIEANHDKAMSIVKSDIIKVQINDLYVLAKEAVAGGDATNAKKYSSDLAQLGSDLSQTYELRIVSRPNENSGVFRLHDDNANVRNYYLIVEAINAAGERVTVPIKSEEDRSSKRTDIWGIRVPESVFNGVAADKRDDAIIQNSLVGEKKRGYLEPEYTIKTSGGKILEW